MSGNLIAGMIFSGMGLEIKSVIKTKQIL